MNTIAKLDKFLRKQGFTDEDIRHEGAGHLFLCGINEVGDIHPVTREIVSCFAGDPLAFTIVGVDDRGNTFETPLFRCSTIEHNVEDYVLCLDVLSNIISNNDIEEFLVDFVDTDFNVEENFNPEVTD